MFSLYRCAGRPGNVCRRLVRPQEWAEVIFEINRLEVFHRLGPMVSLVGPSQKNGSPRWFRKIYADQLVGAATEASLGRLRQSAKPMGGEHTR